MSAARSRSLVLLLAAVLLLTLVPGPAASGSVRGAAPATAAPSAPAAARALPGEDFPSHPQACRDTYDGAPDSCRITTYPGRPWLVLWGDSHALMYLAPIKTLAKRYRINLVSLYFGGCPLSKPFPASSGEQSMSCDTQNAGSLKYVRDLVASGRRVKIIMGSFWAVYRQAYAKLEREWRTGQPSGLSNYQSHHARLAVERSLPLFQAVGRLRASVDVLAQAPWVPENAPPCAESEDPYVCDLPRRLSLPDEAANRRFLADRVRALRHPARLIDPKPVVCDARVCHGRVDGLNTWYDTAHLGMAMTRRMKSYFRPTVRDLLRPPRL
jgi:hypothetical protein